VKELAMIEPARGRWPPEVCSCLRLLLVLES
jgi:hypothetical protein